MFVVHKNGNRRSDETDMAKQQTFGDKTKKKTGPQKISVKIIRGFRGETGTIKFKERFVQVDDLAQVDKMDFNG